MLLFVELFHEVLDEQLLFVVVTLFEVVAAVAVVEVGDSLL